MMHYLGHDLKTDPRDDVVRLKAELWIEWRRLSDEADKVTDPILRDELNRKIDEIRRRMPS